MSVRLFISILFLLPLLGRAQELPADGSWFCQHGKVRSFGQVGSLANARLAYPGDANIDILYYGLDLKLTHTPNYLRGAATVLLKSVTPSLASFTLDLNSTTATSGEGLRVDSVKAGTQKLSYQFASNKLTIKPATALANGQTIRVVVYYQGIPISTSGSFVFGKHEKTSDPAIWTLSEPYGAPDWFPCKDTPAEKVDSSDVRITAPATFVSVSNGTLASITDNPDNTKTYFWRNRHTIAHYLISIASSNYTRYDTPFTSGNRVVPVTHYVYPEVLSSVKANLDLTPKMMQLFSTQFGTYPFSAEKYGHAQFGTGNGGMEHQTISSMEEAAFTPTVIAHELAHQWFGDKITCRNWENIWLNEGFASYAEALYAESTGGRQGYQGYMDRFLTRAKSAQGSIYVQDISSVGNIFNSTRTYAKGAAVLHMLRGVLGDSTFINTLRSYSTSKYAYQTAITEDFQGIAEQVSGKKLGYFFQQWIYGAGYPTYQVSITGSNQANQVSVRLVQRNTTASSPSSFTMPVQLTIKATAGDTTVTVVNDRADQRFTLPSKGTATGVVVDPNNWILKGTEAPAVVTAIEPAATSLTIYPNPSSELVSIDFTTPSAGALSLALTNLLGQRVRSLTEAQLGAGEHSRSLNLRGLSAGRYVLSIQTTAGQQSRVVLVP
ncbi:M1 family aminopeptidase [Spirosoma sp. KUDC1026]|uniref:M1 family aminopeptidase n=1 Tax=Spirosoma sp. KUDC1026 TaxID=2745947 RepID=UPI00159BDD51|nr:M1 family aminopeptidase [Spirosoma sp. KUDC1026]QKZ14608.1 T9SS type A sorting domain-containing protein [Spirosoma sp. KUDC1026]